MVSPRHLLRLALAAFVVASCLAVAPAVAVETRSLFFIDTFEQTSGVPTSVGLDFILAQPSPGAESIAVTVPAGYSMAFKPPGAQIGLVEIDVLDAAGARELVKGLVVVGDPAALASDPQAQACAPGTHSGAWKVSLPSKGTTLPVAVDQLTSGGSVKLTFCLDALRPLNVVPDELYVELEQLFTNPAATGVYTWSSAVTRFTEAGAHDPTSWYELRADESLPQRITAKATWVRTTKRLTVTGRVMAAGEPRDGIRVHVYAGPDPDSLREIGTPLTSSTGTYTLRLKKATAPRYVASDVHYYSFDCLEPSTAPGGCASQSVDGTLGDVVRVTVKRQ
jgi:hypothetical protein